MYNYIQYGELSSPVTVLHQNSNIFSCPCIKFKFQNISYQDYVEGVRLHHWVIGVTMSVCSLSSKSFFQERPSLMTPTSSALNDLPDLLQGRLSSGLTLSLYGPYWFVICIQVAVTRANVKPSSGIKTHVSNLKLEYTQTSSSNQWFNHFYFTRLWYIGDLGCHHLHHDI